MPSSNFVLPHTAPRVRSTSAPVVLGGLIALSVVVRLGLVFERATPRYFPDEALYAGLARSLAQGDGIAVLGTPSSFPSLLQPILTAPFWASGDAELAFRLTQALNAVALGLAAIPVYFLARRMRLTEAAALGCATLALLSPALLYAGYVTADALGYLLGLLAVLLATRALATRTRAAELGFVLAAGLAAFARIQYALLLVAFGAVALATERRRVFRAYPLVSSIFVTGALAPAVLGPSLVGRYHAVAKFGISSETFRWVPATSYLLAAAAGVAIVPATVAWLSRGVAGGTIPERVAFARILTVTGLLLVAVSIVMTVETGSDRFLERYLIVLTPLLAIGFACWADEGRPGRAIGVCTGVLLVLAAARLPLAEYAAGMGRADSPTLLALGRASELLGIGEASLLTALVVTGAAAVGTAACISARVRPAVVGAIAASLLAATSVGAHSADIGLSRFVERTHFTRSPTWVDRIDASEVLLVQTPGSDRLAALSTIFWNTSITQATALGTSVEPVEGMRDTLSLDRQGAISLRGKPVSGSVLWATGGTRTIVATPTQTVRDRLFTLTTAREPIRLAALATGLDTDGWLRDGARVTIFPAREGRCRIATLRLKLPANVSSRHVRLGDAELRLQSGVPATRHVRVGLVAHSFAVRAERPFTVFASPAPVAAQATIAVRETSCGR